MIIFDLDTLADCEHRRHFVDPNKHHCSACATWIKQEPVDHLECPSCGKCPTNFKPDWQSFYEACDKDLPIKSTIKIFKHLEFEELYQNEIQIWSGRCESVRWKTEHWLFLHGFPIGIGLKMRPIGDYTPDDVLKERWLDEALNNGETIDFVFDDRPKVIRMWRRRGIFVFNCAQHDEEF